MGRTLTPITGPQVGEFASKLQMKGIGKEGFQVLIDDTRPFVRLLAAHPCGYCKGTGMNELGSDRSPAVSHSGLCPECGGTGLRYIRSDRRSIRGFWVPGIVTPGKNKWSHELARLTGGGVIYCTNCGGDEVYYRTDMQGLMGCKTCHTNTNDHLAWSTQAR